METNSPEPVDDSKLVLPVIREDLQVGIRQVDTGRGVRIHKTVSQEPFHIDQTLLRDAVEVRRVPVDRVVALSDAPAARQEGDTLIVPVLEEILVVEKRLRIKEEVHITRSARQEQYADTVVLRTENVEVERVGDEPGPEINSTRGGTHHAAHTRSRI